MCVSCLLCLSSRSNRCSVLCVAVAATCGARSIFTKWAAHSVAPLHVSARASHVQHTSNVSPLPASGVPLATRWSLADDLSCGPLTDLSPWTKYSVRKRAKAQSQRKNRKGEYVWKNEGVKKGSSSEVMSIAISTSLKTRSDRSLGSSQRHQRCQERPAE